jgi:hypothetical protein
MLFIISSVHKRSGFLYKKIKDNHGKDDATILAVMGSTRNLISHSINQSLTRRLRMTRSGSVRNIYASGVMI